MTDNSPLYIPIKFEVNDKLVLYGISFFVSHIPLFSLLSVSCLFPSAARAGDHWATPPLVSKFKGPKCIETDSMCLSRLRFPLIRTSKPYVCNGTVFVYRRASLLIISPHKYIPKPFPARHNGCFKIVSVILSLFAHR